MQDNFCVISACNNDHCTQGLEHCCLDHVHMPYPESNSLPHSKEGSYNQESLPYFKYTTITDMDSWCLENKGNNNDTSCLESYNPDSMETEDSCGCAVCSTWCLPCQYSEIAFRSWITQKYIYCLLYFLQETCFEGTCHWDPSRQSEERCRVSLAPSSCYWDSDFWFFSWKQVKLKVCTVHAPCYWVAWSSCWCYRNVGKISRNGAHAWGTVLTLSFSTLWTQWP